jgi:uncharacterized phiE125 gp8 family phage protein
MIITKADLDAYLKITTDATQGADVVNAVNAYIKTATGRLFGSTLIVVGERHDFANTIWLNNMDVVSIEAIRVGLPNQGTPQALASDAYWFNKYGRVNLAVLNMDRYPSRYWYDLVAVDYTFGVTTVPDDLKLAALQLAAQYYKYIGSGNQVITSAGVGTYRVSYGSGKAWDDVLGRYAIKRF